MFFFCSAWLSDLASGDFVIDLILLLIEETDEVTIIN